MLTLDDIQSQVEYSRKYSGLTDTNYWVYISVDGIKCEVRNREKKKAGYVGYFVEDDTKLKNIHTTMLRKIK